MVGRIGTMDDDLGGDDGFLGVEEQRLFGREVPFLAEALGTITCAEFPEGGVPWSAIPLARVGAGGDQPAFHDLLEKSVPEQALAMNAGEFLRLENTVAALLEIPENRQGRREFFIGGRHVPLSSASAKTLMAVPLSKGKFFWGQDRL